MRREREGGRQTDRDKETGRNNNNTDDDFLCVPVP